MIYLFLQNLNLGIMIVYINKFCKSCS